MQGISPSAEGQARTSWWHRSWGSRSGNPSTGCHLAGVGASNRGRSTKHASEAASENAATLLAISLRACDRYACTEIALTTARTETKPTALAHPNGLTFPHQPGDPELFDLPDPAGPIACNTWDVKFDETGMSGNRPRSWIKPSSSSHLPRISEFRSRNASNSASSRSVNLRCQAISISSWNSDSFMSSPV
jgi:hypothetical protein